MTLLAPAFLWTLAALAPLAAIYFLKVRPRKKPVTAFFLWQKIFTEKKASALFKRLRDVLSLLLMALAFAAIAFALAEPDFAGDERKDLLIVVDHSASMSAKDGATTRLEKAKKRARDLIAGMNGTQRAAVASFAEVTRILEHPTRHRKALIEAVDAIQPTELPSRVEALRALQPGDEWMKDTRVLLITDGCLDLPDRLPNVEVLRITDSAKNIGIARADLRSVPGGPARLGLFILPVSSFTEPVKTDITLTHVDSDRMVKIIPITLNPGENPAITLTLDDAPTGSWKATLGLEDALESDNTAYLYVPPSQPVPVAVLADDPFFFQNAVSAFERSDQLLSLAQETKSARLMLSKGKVPADISTVVFQPTGEATVWSNVGAEIAAPVPKVLAKDHPLLRYLDAESMTFAGARQITAPTGAVILVADESGPPLIYLMRQGAQTVCVVNLDPLAAQFYLSAWFPVLIHNAAAHLTHREDMPPATLPTGSTARVPGRADPTPFGPMLTTGFHQADEWTFATSLVSPEESLLKNDTLKESVKPIASGEAPSYWLLVLALGVLVTESILYDRRKVG
ncbi:VWA domain-containing protein [Prosthecobacter sp.]|uniref:VWA domain-containing protein n=1 Tax=Prosthecobacter sp. TaxID=1965333 RepID=UPI0037846B67